MSRTTYTVDVDEFICTELEYIRKMWETRDFSSLPATVERIQYHANAMEAAIGAAFDKKYRVASLCDDEDMSDAEFRTKVKEAMEDS